MGGSPLSQKNTIFYSGPFIFFHDKSLLSPLILLLLYHEDLAREVGLVLQMDCGPSPFFSARRIKQTGNFGCTTHIVHQNFDVPQQHPPCGHCCLHIMALAPLLLFLPPLQRQTTSPICHGHLCRLRCPCRQRHPCCHSFFCCCF
jgi:hypothetical protein